MPSAAPLAAAAAAPAAAPPANSLCSGVAHDASRPGVAPATGRGSKALNLLAAELTAFSCNLVTSIERACDETVVVMYRFLRCSWLGLALGLGLGFASYYGQVYYG